MSATEALKAEELSGKSRKDLIDLLLAAQAAKVAASAEQERVIGYLKERDGWDGSKSFSQAVIDLVDATMGMLTTKSTTPMISLPLLNGKSWVPIRHIDMQMSASCSDILARLGPVLEGRRLADGRMIHRHPDVLRWMLEQAAVALTPREQVAAG